LLLFPPLARKAFHEALLDEILEERVVSSRGRRNPRVVKRKMSSWPVKSRNQNSLPVRQVNINIVVIK